MDNQSEKAFVIALKNGDKSILGKLFDLYYRDLYKILFTRVSDKAIIPDFIQDSFVKLWEKRASIDPDKSIKSFIFRIAINLVIDHYKHEAQKNKHQDVISELYESESKSESAFVEDVYTLVSKLPTELSTTFFMSKLGEMSYKDIADTLDISIKTVESRISKVLKICREKIKYKME